ncbi:MAG: ParB N-terminal domain-containing protein [Paludibacteraceae bacterium]|nr:ParB N-terminal domain-containing protein [Paludibacteraceae bacterium]
MTTQNISLSLLVPNDGNQIKGLQANPRTITEVEFNRLKQSMKSLPELLQYRPLIVAEMENGKYCIISGNMKYAAALDMKWKELPCKIIPRGGGGCRYIEALDAKGRCILWQRRHAGSQGMGLQRTQGMGGSGLCQAI